MYNNRSCRPCTGRGPQIFDITHKTEGTRTADLAHERIRREVHRVALAAESIAAFAVPMRNPT